MTLVKTGLEINDETSMTEDQINEYIRIYKNEGKKAADKYLDDQIEKWNIN